MKRVLGLVLLTSGVMILGASIVILVLLIVNNGKPIGIAIMTGALAIPVLMLWSAVRVMPKAEPIGQAPTVAAPESILETIDIGDFRCTTQYLPPVKEGKHNCPSLLRVSVAIPPSDTFTIRRETRFDRFFKRLGIATEISTQDPAFDDTCYIRTDATDFVSDYLRDAGRRQAIHALLNLNFPEVAVNNGQIQANWTGFDAQKQDVIETATKAMPHLLVLAQDYPEREPSPIEAAVRSRNTWNIFFWVFLVLYSLTIFSVFVYRPISGWQLIGKSLFLMIPGYLALGWLAALMLGGGSTSHDRWALLMGVGLLLFPVGSVGSFALMNGAFDESPVETHFAPVVRQHTSKSKNTINYKVEVRYWRDADDTISYTISRAEYEQTVIGQSVMEVRSQGGYFGVEWERSKQFHTRGRP